ncbi:MAG: tyrosine--tRNA ligase [Spirochaetes bacterium]|nr:tyrosine--tRNA ligase [Spirochaetota bacterium]
MEELDPTIREAVAKIQRGCAEIISEDELVAKLVKSKKTGKPLVIKAGFDPTAPDIHLGHSVLLRKMRHFQELGHKVVFLIGDFTGMIGDPSGRSKTRRQLSREDVLLNAETYKEQVYKILDKETTVIEFNSHWCERMKFSDVLSLTSRYTVARMLERDDFTKRYKEGKPIAMLEFMYPLVQGYDSVALNADVELGGTDQKFNLLVGRELMREYGLEPQVIVTMPILEGLDGVEKMSKSLGNYVGINESPKDMFGKLMSIPDHLITRYMELLTDLPMTDIERHAQEMTAGKNPRDVKVLLAKTVVGMYHSAKDADAAEAEFSRIFSGGGIPDDIEDITLENGIAIFAALKSVLPSESNSQLRRYLEQGSVRLDDEKIEDAAAVIDLSRDRILKVGKRKFFRLKQKAN